MAWRHFLLTTKQLAKIEAHFDYRGIKLDQEHLKNVVEFWHERASMKCEIDLDKKPLDMTGTINHVLMKHKDLLLIDTNAMDKRLKAFDDMGFIYRRSFMKLFQQAPEGWFLQDWADFSKKFSYFQYRILKWLLQDEKDPWPDPHPLIYQPTIMEESYEHMKTRLTFVQAIGLKPQDINGSQALNIGHTLKKMLLTNKTEFVARFAPAIREEEYDFLENLIENCEDEEDKLLDEMSDLTVDYSTAYVDEDKLFRQQARKKFGTQRKLPP